jgi:hypothetical protein
MRQGALLLGAWALLWVGCSAILAVMSSGMGDKLAILFLVVGILFGVGGGITFTALCLLQGSGVMTFGRYAALGAVAAVPPVIYTIATSTTPLTVTVGGVVWFVVATALSAASGLGAGLVVGETSE